MFAPALGGAGGATPNALGACMITGAEGAHVAHPGWTIVAG
jgi:hypothetical protein